jgi:hypothetical protein
VVFQLAEKGRLRARSDYRTTLAIGSSIAIIVSVTIASIQFLAVASFAVKSVKEFIILALYSSINYVSVRGIESSITTSNT